MKLNKECFKKRKVIQLSAPFLLSFLVFISCNKETNELGLDLQNDQIAGTVIVDTFQLKTFSDFDDSLRSTQTTKSLLGSYNDPYLGQVNVGFYTQLRMEADDPNFENPGSIVVDSLILSLDYEGYYGDFIDQNIEVYRVTEDMNTETDYYRFSTLATDGTNLELTGSPYFPNYYGVLQIDGDTLDPQLRIKLDPALGQEFITADGNGSLANNETFLSYFKGLYIKVDNGVQNNEGGVLYFNPFSTNSKMTMYYTDNGVVKDFSFNINENCARFNAYENDYTGTPAENVIDNPENGGKTFYVQSGALRGAIEFPTLKNLRDLEDDIVIVKAELILPVQYNSSSSLLRPLSLFVLEQLESGLQTFIYDNYDPNHVGGTLDEDDNSYSFIITRFVQRILTGESENSSLRVLSPNHFASVERLVLNGQNSDLKDKPKLVITYTKF